MFAVAMKHLLSPTSIILIAATSLVSGAYMVLKPTEPVLSTAQVRLIDRLDREAGLWLGQMEPTQRSAVLTTFNRDPFAHISDCLREVIWRSDRFDLCDYSVAEKFWKRIEWTRPVAESRRDAVHTAARRGSDYVIWGTVEEFSDVKSPAQLVVALEVVEVANSRPVTEQRFEITDEPGLGTLVTDTADKATGFFQFSLLTGLLVWVGFTLLLPLLAYPFIKRVVLGDSNAAILTMLISTVFASVFVCYLILVRGAGPWLSAIVLLIAFAVALYYYYKTFEIIKKVNE